MASSRSRLVGALVALASGLALLLGSAPSAQAADVVHRGPSWSWTGPRSWDASYGTYGITVVGDRGATLDLGFSSVLCAPGARWDDSVEAYFARQRRQLRQAGWRFTDVSRIAHPVGSPELYRRQTLTGRVQGRTGRILLDYDFTTNVDGVDYCYQRSLATYALTAAWPSRRGTLERVRRSLAYSGPGAPGEDPTL